MKKKIGDYIVECYDQFGHNVKKKRKKTFMAGREYATKFVDSKEGNSAVVSRVLINTLESKNGGYGG